MENKVENQDASANSAMEPPTHVPRSDHQSNTPPQPEARSGISEYDPAANIDHPVPGWPTLSKLMAEIPDFQGFQAFSDLNIKSLLYYQAELIQLRMELHEAEWRDSRNQQEETARLGVGHRTAYAENLEYLLSSRNKTDPTDHKQWTLITKIREVLKEYNEALFQYSQLNALPAADKYNVNSLRLWIKNGENTSISGPGNETWGDLSIGEPRPTTLFRQSLHLLRTVFWAPGPQGNSLGLKVPFPGHSVDNYTLWLANEFVPFYNSLRKYLNSRKTSRRDWDLESLSRPAYHRTEIEQATLVTYSEGIVDFRSTGTTLFACLLPTLAIAVLSTIHKTGELIGVIGIFTAVFAIGLMYFTSKRPSRVEIFSATAA